MRDIWTHSSFPSLASSILFDKYRRCHFIHQKTGYKWTRMTFVSGPPTPITFEWSDRAYKWSVERRIGTTTCCNSWRRARKWNPTDNLTFNCGDWRDYLSNRRLRPNRIRWMHFWSVMSVCGTWEIVLSQTNFNHSSISFYFDVSANLLTIVTISVKTENNPLWESLYSSDCKFTHPSISRDSTIPLKKRCWCPTLIYGDLTEFPPHRTFPHFPILTYQIHYFSISSSVIRPSCPTHLGRPWRFPSISQPTIPLSRNSLSHFRGDSMRSFQLITSRSISSLILSDTHHPSRYRSSSLVGDSLKSNEAMTASPSAPHFSSREAPTIHTPHQTDSLPSSPSIETKSLFFEKLIQIHEGGGERV
jgi:hypothetical protein